MCQYSGETNIVESFTNTFSALWEYIINSNEYKDISELTELNSNSSSRIDNEQKTFYYVSQETNFLINKELDLYGRTSVRIDTQEKKNGGSIESQVLFLGLIKMFL